MAEEFNILPPVGKYKHIQLKAKGVEALGRCHPWLFRGALGHIPANIQEGDIVNLTDGQNKIQAIGLWQEGGSIALRLLSFSKTTIDQSFWKEKLASAINLRKGFSLIDNSEQEICRLVNAEGDGLPGLIIDKYGSTAVIQTHNWGMYRQQINIAKALKEVLGDSLDCIYDKSKESLPKQFSAQVENKLIEGSTGYGNFKENGHSFFVDWENGQKTGFFIDQRNNRELLGKLAKGKSVLNTFCYSGGFSIYALKGGATKVESVDSSKKAIDWLNKNIELNDLQNAPHSGVKADVGDYFNEENNKKWDIIVLDPPAYAKHLKKRHSAIKGYARLNYKAMKKINQGGYLMTYSCSGVVSPEQFEGAVRSAAIEANRPIRIIKRLGPPEDHPISIFHPEGQYLKGLLLQLH